MGLALAVQRLSHCHGIWKGKSGVGVAGTSPCAGEVMVMGFTVRVTSIAGY